MAGAREYPLGPDSPRLPRTGGPNRLETLENLRRYLAKVMRCMWNNTLDPHIGGKLVTACDVMLRIMTKLEVNDRIQELEQKYVELQNRTAKIMANQSQAARDELRLEELVK